MNFGQFTSAAIVTALEAGELLKRGFGTHFMISSKEGHQNLVTEYDLLSQELIINRLKKRFPEHQFLAEEGQSPESFSKEVIWIIDPLDGTVNFARGIPAFSVSIAAMLNGEIVSGVVFNPLLNELFIAEKGIGSYLNGHPLQVSKIDEITRSCMATGFPYNADENPLHCIDRFAKMAKLAIPLRRIGSAALDLSYVAAGRFDAFWEVGLHSWDMAAGKLIVEEAGGKVTRYDGTTHPIFGYHPTVASNGRLHAKLVALLKEDLT